MVLDASPFTTAVRDAGVLDSWNEFLSGHQANAGFLQTAAWAQIEAAAAGAQHQVIEVHDEALNLRAGALISIHRVPRRLRGLPSRPDVVVTCSDGPVFSPGETAALRETLAGVDLAATSVAATLISMRGLPPACGRSDAPEVVRVFTEMGYRVRRWATSLVALDDDATMRSRLKPAARKAIRKAREAGVIVSACESRDEFVRNFVLPYATWTVRDDDFVRRAKAMWDADDGRAYRYFVALLDDRPIATLGTYRWGGVATEVMSGRAPDTPPAVPCQDAVHWEAFRSHRDLGERTFDLAGYNPAPSSAKEAGIRRFKSKWGGAEVGTVMFEQARPRHWLSWLRQRNQRALRTVRWENAS